MEKKKLPRKERLRITRAIEDLLETHCRPCPVPGKEHNSNCAGCAIFPKLRGYGAELGEENGERKRYEPLPQKYLDLARKNGIQYNTFVTRLSKGMLPEDAATLPTKPRTTWDQKEIDHLFQLLKEGHTQKDAAVLLGRTEHAVNYRMSVLRKEGIM